MNTNLSIVLPLNGRQDFTWRAINNMRGVGRLVVADGSRDYQLVPSEATDFDYFYIGHDTSLGRWWYKMVLAFDRVETPYAMVADNDDLLMPDGINRCIDFLERNPDYIACSGRIQGFWAWPDQVVGPRFSRTSQYAPFDVPADYGQQSANERVLSGFQNSWSYYAVYRTEALKAIWIAVYNLGLTHLQVHEKFCAMKALTLGKIRCDGGFTSYQRQYGTSIGGAGQAPFHERFLSDNFSVDRDKVFNHLSLCSDVDIPVLRMLWAEWYRGFLLREYGPWPTIRKALKRRFPRTAWAVQNRHRWGLA